MTKIVIIIKLNKKIPDILKIKRDMHMRIPFPAIICRIFLKNRKLGKVKNKL